MLKNAYRAIVQAVGGASRSESSPRLVSVGSKNLGDYAIPEDRDMYMGRDSENDIVLPYGTHSRRHARIISFGYGHGVQDLGSMFGTYLNGQDIGELGGFNKRTLPEDKSQFTNDDWKEFHRGYTGLKNGDVISFGSPNSAYKLRYRE